MNSFATKLIAACAMLAGAAGQIHAQTGTVNAICSTDRPWCELAAQEFTRATGIKVNQSHKPTGEAQAHWHYWPRPWCYSVRSG